MLNGLEKSFFQRTATQDKNQGVRMTKSGSSSFAMAVMFTLNCGFAVAEEPAGEPQVKIDVSTHPEKSTSPKEETANKKQAEKDAAKPTEDPNCE